MTERPVQVDIREINRQITQRYREDGVYESDGMPLVLLTIRGRVSGELRTTPVAVQPDGDRLVVVGSMGGLPTHPQWYQNLDADPNITVEYRGDRYAAVARTVEPGEERDRLIRLMTTAVPGLPRYEQRAADHRVIPIVIIERAGESA
ncbi:MAG: nitroreductase/quinone reductase family protein [Candidatus Nanopelagicales bacterium]|nr:nitroreductase/quinone reductase family protein [Candidatus Nanopelagicales bacterium]